MFFKRYKPTVTEEDRQMIEEAFQWIERQHTTDFLKKATPIEPNEKYFDRQFDHSEEDAHYLLKIIAEYMQVSLEGVELHFYIHNSHATGSDGVKIISSDAQDGSTGNIQSTEDGKFRIGIERRILQNTQGLIATIAHELSHLILLGEGRMHEDDELGEIITDLNCIAMGFGIFISNSIFNFSQFSDGNWSGWEYDSQGYLPEEVAAYAMALLQNYQQCDDSWTDYLKETVYKQYKRNLKFIQQNPHKVQFK